MLSWQSAPTLENSLLSSLADDLERVAYGGGKVWTPQPGPQTLGYESPADELFYGGAAGGGKSDLLLGLSFTAHRKSIIFRREYPQLAELVTRGREILAGTGARFNANDHTWRGIPGKRVVEFGAVQYLWDVERFQGRAHDLLGFDELTHFLEQQYEILIGWNRTTIPGQRVRVVATGNPPLRPEGEWVIRRWGPWLDRQHPRPAAAGELRWYALIDGSWEEREDGTPFDWKGETVYPKSRTFIPASLADNPILEQTGYRATVQAMPEPMRSKLLYGDFSIGFEDDPWQVIPTEWVIQAEQRWETMNGAEQPLTAMGVDVARGGGDQTVIAKRYGAWVAPLIKRAGKATPDGQAVAQLVIEHLEGDVPPAIDIIGIGSAPYDALKMQGIRAIPINFAEGSEGTDRSGRLKFANVRAELYWRLREALDPETGEGLALPPDRELRADLCAAKWKITARGIQIESKEDIIKRIGRSPDCGDAVVMALSTPFTEIRPMPGKLFTGGRRGTRKRH